jgi:dihydrofolate reductase
MKIRLITAIDDNYLIGDGNSLPWNLPEDLQRFKEMTTGNTVVMGRKTYESIGKPLPDRKNIVLTSQVEGKFLLPGACFINSIDKILDMNIEGDLYVIGGAQIYEQFYPYSDFIHLTITDDTYKGDTYLPFTILDIENDFNIINREYFKDFMCVNYERKNPNGKI